jgi:ATP-binding cassette, subfamily C, bacterial exporter for protease/lipase
MTTSIPALVNLLASQRPLIVRLVVLSGVINLLTLSLSLFTMQVYDRVLTSQNVDTLLFLTLATTIAIALSTILSAVRQNVASRAGTWMGLRFAPELLTRSLEQRLAMPGMRLEALREFSSVRSFVASPSVFSLIDSLWVPLYLAVIMLISPPLGLVALVGAIILFALAYLNEAATRRLIGASQSLAADNLNDAESLIRNSEAIDAMGMTGDVVARWARQLDAESDASAAAQARANTILSASRFVRYAIQIALYAIGALLVLSHDITAGALIGASILSARLLAPVEGAMTFWKQFVLARTSFKRLTEFASLPPLRASSLELPRPSGQLTAAGVTYAPTGRKVPILRNISFEIDAGDFLAIAGPSASGKSTLARLIVGATRPLTGRIRLDGADTFEWRRPDFGYHVGYLPQDVELLPGSIRDNIARFRADASDHAVITAAIYADCHQMILELPDGYDTILSDGGQQLSGGQRQRIGLARALFGDPRLMVLDEPNASLDAAGEAALVRALQRLKIAKVTTIFVSHRMSLIALADKVLVLRNGGVAGFGPAAEVLAPPKSVDAPDPQIAVAEMGQRR